MLGVANTVARDNRDADIEVVEVDVDSNPLTAFGVGAVVCPTTIVRVGDNEVHLSGVRSRRAVLHVLLPLLYDPDTALAELRRQLGSPDEEFPRRTKKRLEKISQVTRVSMLGTVPLFSGLSKKQLKALATASHEVVLHDAATVITEGEDGDEFFIVADGTATVARGGDTLANLRAGDHFGEMSLIDDGPRTATVTTDGPATLLAIDRDTFRTLLADSPDTSLALMTTLAQRLRE